MVLKTRDLNDINHHIGYSLPFIRPLNDVYYAWETHLNALMSYNNGQYLLVCQYLGYLAIGSLYDTGFFEVEDLNPDYSHNTTYHNFSGCTQLPKNEACRGEMLKIWVIRTTIIDYRILTPMNSKGTRSLKNEARKSDMLFESPSLLIRPSCLRLLG